MRILKIPQPLSAGLFLSYKCNAECKHCMYGCSPKWKTDWISEKNAEEILSFLANKLDSNFFSFNSGLHLTGGEPFLNFSLLLKLIKIAKRLNISPLFVETNSFWATDEKITRERLKELKSAGLDLILISVNPFLIEKVPFENIERAIKISNEVFERYLIIYQEFFYYQFKKFKIKGTLKFEEYLKLAGIESLNYIELLPLGRAVYKLSFLFKKFKAEKFFGYNCTDNLLNPWHTHIDNYGNYITGFCSGIAITNFENLREKSTIDLDEYPIIDALLKDIKKLYEIGKEWGYKEKEEGYISKCHLCLDIRKFLVERTDKFKELAPKEFYYNL